MMAACWWYSGRFGGVLKMVTILSSALLGGVMLTSQRGHVMPNSPE